MATLIRHLVACVFLISTDHTGHGFSLGYRGRQHRVVKRDVKDIKLAPMTLDASCELVCPDSGAEYLDDCTYECSLNPIFDEIPTTESHTTPQIRKKVAPFVTSTTSPSQSTSSLPAKSTTPMAQPPNITPVTQSTTITTTEAATAPPSTTITTTEAATTPPSTTIATTTVATTVSTVRTTPEATTLPLEEYDGERDH